MTRTRFIYFSLFAVVLTGCPIRQKDGGSVDAGGDLPEVRKTVADGSDGPADGAGVDGGADGTVVVDTQEAPPPLPMLTIIAPANGTHTNGKVNVSVMVAAGETAPDSISILENGASIATVTAPFQYLWDTTAVPEGTYTLAAQTTVGTRVATSPPINVNVDRTPPSVRPTTPVTGSVGVILSAPIGAVFSEPILAASLGAAPVTLMAGAVSVPVNATLSADGTTVQIRITDSSAVTLPTTFTLTFASTVTDLAGNALTPLVAPWQWTVPDWIKTPALVGTGDPRLVVDSGARPFVAYGTTKMVNSDFVYGVSAAHFDGQSWTDMAVPTDPVNTSNGGYAIAIDAADNPTVAWVQLDAPGARIHVATRTGSNWLSLPPLSSGITSTATADIPVVKVDRKGAPIVAWRENTPAGNDIFLAHLTGTLWDRTFGAVGFSGGDLVFGLDMVLDNSDSPVVGWSTSLSGVATWNAGWSISRDSLSKAAPSVGIDGDGLPVMAVLHGSLSAQVFRYPQWYGEPSTPVPSSLTNTQFPNLAMTSTHLPVLAWLDTTGPNEVGLARWTGTKWDTRPGLFHGDGTVDLVNPTVVLDGEDHMWVAWNEGGQINVWMSNY